MHNLKLRRKLILTACEFVATGLSVGTSGNLSARTARGFLITPTGVPYSNLLPDDLIEINAGGEILSGALLPSSEWPFHRSIYLARTEINAIVHVHSPFATGIACAREDIPAFHYMVARAGGDSIRCAEYATFGTEELSLNAVRALESRKACLLANHGQITLGEDIQSAFVLAQEVEDLAKQYWISRLFSAPVLLDSKEMEINLEKFKNYGKQKIKR
jgi:L-fuculose-phosphate aldolase